MVPNILTEDEISKVYHHGSFKDLQTFLDKNGDPYVLIPSSIPKKDNKDSSQSNSSSNGS